METAEYEGHTDKFEPFVDFLIYKRNTFPVHLTNRSFQIHERYTQYKYCNKIGYKKYTTSVFVDEVREPPEGPEADCESNHGQ